MTQNNGRKIINAYAGEEAASGYIDRIFQTSPILGNRTLGFVFGEVMASPVITYAQKAIIHTTALTAVNGSSVALDFHKAAMKHHGVMDLDQPVRLGFALREGNISAFEHRWTIGRRAFHMAKITAFAGMGQRYTKDLDEALGESLNAIGHKRTAYAAEDLTAVIHGFDAAEKTATALHRIVSPKR